MDVNNTNGFGTAADKLITVLKNSIGLFVDPIKKWIDSKVDLNIELAKAKKQKEIDRVLIGNEIDKAKNQFPLEVINLMNRTKLRNLETELQRQVNIESMVVSALEHLPEDAQPELLNRDWLNFFFSKCQDISEEELKTVWGKILASESTQQNSFSRITLNCLTNMSAIECRLFEKLCSLVTVFKNYYIILKINNNKFSESYNYEFTDFLHLCDMGIVNNSEIANIPISKNQWWSVTTLSGDKYSIVNTTAEDKYVMFYILSTAGRELSKLFKVTTDDTYLRNLKTDLGNHGLNLVAGEYTQINTINTFLDGQKPD